jgi:hypothetical protein
MFNMVGASLSPVIRASRGYQGPIRYAIGCSYSLRWIAVGKIKRTRHRAAVASNHALSSAWRERDDCRTPVFDAALSDQIIQFDAI